MSNKDLRHLISGFNRRDKAAFGELYTLYYDELFLFASSLFKETNIDPSDVIHDIFIRLWQSENITFKDLINLKAYIYVSIKNAFKSYIAHEKHVDNHRNEIIKDEDYLMTEIIEIETFSTINQAINMLPEDCAKVLRLHLEGWDIKTIAAKLGTSERTIYNKKYEAIDILRNKLNKPMLKILIHLLGSV